MTPVRTERGWEPPGRHSSCGIIRCETKHAGQPVALGDEGVAPRAKARDPAGHEREREELARLALAPGGVLEEEEREDSCKWKSEEGQDAPGGAAEHPGC